MKDNFRKGFVLIAALFFSGYVAAQEDSTDLNFYRDTAVFLTEEDSLTYAGFNAESLQLEFELTDTTVYKIWLELLVASDFLGSQSIILEDYTLEELEANEWYES